MFKSFAVVCLTSIAAALEATECAFQPNEHFIKSLPYFRADQELPCMYSGTLPVNTAETHHMFYWMHTNENADAPLMVYMNGGPGASSMFANFLLNGPLRISHGAGSDDYQVYLNPEGSWAELVHLVFIDQPIGTGFSYGEPLNTTMDETADEFVNFFTKFYEMYPQFVGRDLYIAGESYAGKYVPRYTYALLKENEKLGNRKFNIKSSFMGDPYTAPLAQRTHMFQIPEALNMIDDSNMPQIAALHHRCQEAMGVDFDFAHQTCLDIMNYIQGVTGNVLPYDTRIFEYDWNPLEDAVTDYFTISAKVEDIYEAIHIDQSTKDPVFSMSSKAVGNAFTYDNMLDYSWYVEELLRMKQPILLYAGEFDTRDGPSGQEFWLRNLQFEGSEDFWAQSRKVYYVPQPGSPDFIVGGYWRESEYFSFLTVPKSGHFVPANYLQPTLQFVSDYMNYTSLVCHKSHDGCSVVNTRCSFMNDCSNNGSCTANGVCECFTGFKGADCSAKSILIDGTVPSYAREVSGPTWTSLTVTDDARRVHISTDLPADIYVTRGKDSDPNEFVHDMKFIGQKDITLSPRLFSSLQGGYSVAIYQEAYDEKKNTFLKDTLKVETGSRDRNWEDERPDAAREDKLRNHGKNIKDKVDAVYDKIKDKFSGLFNRH